MYSREEILIFFFIKIKNMTKAVDIVDRFAEERQEEIGKLVHRIGDAYSGIHLKGLPAYSIIEAYCPGGSPSTDFLNEIEEPKNIRDPIFSGATASVYNITKKIVETQLPSFPKEDLPLFIIPTLAWLACHHCPKEDRILLGMSQEKVKMFREVFPFEACSGPILSLVNETIITMPEEYKDLEWIPMKYYREFWELPINEKYLDTVLLIRNL